MIERMVGMKRCADSSDWIDICVVSVNGRTVVGSVLCSIRGDDSNRISERDVCGDEWMRANRDLASI